MLIAREKKVDNPDERRRVSEREIDRERQRQTEREREQSIKQVVHFVVDYIQFDLSSWLNDYKPT